MNGSTFPVIRSLRETAKRRTSAGLETLETALRSRNGRRLGLSVTRPALLSILSCALFGLGSAAVRAQTTPPVQDPATAKPAPTVPAPTAPAAPPAPVPGAVTITGLIEGSYGINFNHPQKSTAIGTTLGAINHVDNVGRTFDYHQAFGFQLGELNISRTANKSFPLGATATLTIGDAPPIVYGNEPGPRRGYEGIQQLYLTYTPHVLGRDVAIDFGKFVSPFGLEVIESANDDQFSRGFVFQYALPFYHTGFRFAAPVNSKVNFVGGIVNGWNNTADDNTGKSAFAQFTYTASPKFTAILGYMGGPEGTGAYGINVPTNGGGSIGTNLFEFEPILNATPKLKFAADIVYGSAAGSVSGQHVSGTWLGMAGYGRYQITPTVAAGVRLEQFEDSPGAGFIPNGMNPQVGLRLGNGSYTKLNSFTITLEHQALHGHLISRLEYRHDRSTGGSPIFLGNTASGFVPDQDTLYLGESYKF